MEAQNLFLENTSSYQTIMLSKHTKFEHLGFERSQKRNLSKEK